MEKYLIEIQNLLGNCIENLERFERNSESYRKKVETKTKDGSIKDLIELTDLYVGIQESILDKVDINRERLSEIYRENNLLRNVVNIDEQLSEILLASKGMRKNLIKQQGAIEFAVSLEKSIKEEEEG